MSSLYLVYYATSMLPMLNGGEIDGSLHGHRLEGVLQADYLEDVFDKMNNNSPSRSMSVGDVVIKRNGGSWVAWVCKPVGWEKFALNIHDILVVTSDFLARDCLLLITEIE